MGYPHASFLIWPSLFASLMLQVATYAFASAETDSNGIQASQQASVQLTFSKQSGTAIRLETRTAPLEKILKAIADKTGAIIHYSVLPEPPVTATCVGTNVGQIMDCLVAKQVGLVANKPQKDMPAEFWLLGSSVGSCQAVTVVPTVSPVKVVAEQPRPEDQAQVEQALQKQTDQLLKQARSKDPNQRAEAIGNIAAIGLKDEPAIDETLRSAMNDKDANVRAQAIRAIVQRGGEEIAEQIGMALKDKDVNVRLTAVSDIQDDETLLQQALNDSDPMIRDLAKSKLDDMAYRQNK